MENEKIDRSWTPTVVAKWFGVSAESLRHWERIGKITTKVSRTAGGHRRYTLENVKEIAALMGRDVPTQALE